MFLNEFIREWWWGGGGDGDDDDDGQFFSRISLQVYVCMCTHGVKLLQQRNE